MLQSILGARTVSYNSLFAKAIGNVPATVFLSQAIFWQEKSKFKSGDTMEIDGETYFSKTGAEWHEETGMSLEQQKTARKLLCSIGFLKEKLAGIPGKMYYKIDIDVLVSGISGYLNTGLTVSGNSGNRKTENPRTGKGKFRKQENGKSEGSLYIESFESFERKNESAGASGLLTPPFKKTGEIEIELHDPEIPGCIVRDMVAVEEHPKKEKTSPGGGAKLQKRASKTREEIETAEQVIQYLNEKSGRSFRVNNNENAKGIIGQLRQGFTIEQMKKVIDHKVASWGKDIKMAEHLNPITLFRPANFERYLSASELPKDAGPKQPAPNPNRVSLNSAGGDYSKYLEKQIF